MAKNKENDAVAPIRAYESIIEKSGIQPETHSHEYIELIYVSEGELEAVVNEAFLRVAAGEMMIINPGTSHGFSTQRKKCRFTVINFLSGLICDTHFSLLELKYIIPFISPSTNARKFSSPLVKKSPVQHLFGNIVEELNGDLPGKLISVRCSLLSIFVFIIRHCPDEELSLENSPADSELLKSINRAVEYMHNNLAHVNEKEIAEMCGLSYSYFSRSFKRIMHMSFSEYCNKTRVAESEKMLIETGLSVNEIASALGFSSASHYIQTFRRFKDCSPKKYRTFIHGKNKQQA